MVRAGLSRQCALGSGGGCSWLEPWDLLLCSAWCPGPGPREQGMGMGMIWLLLQAPGQGQRPERTTGCTWNQGWEPPWCTNLQSKQEMLGSPGTCPR